MIELIAPLLLQRDGKPQSGASCSDILSSTSDLVSVAGNLAEDFTKFLSAAGIAAVVINFLGAKYQGIPLTALCFGAYIVDLTLILHNLFMDMLLHDPPRPVSREFVRDTLRSYKTENASRVHDLVHDIVYGRQALRPEERIADLIRKELRMDPLQDIPASRAHNERLEVRNEEPEASTQGVEIVPDQITGDSIGIQDVNMGEDRTSGVREPEQNGNTGENDKVESTLPKQNTDAGDQGGQHEDSEGCCKSIFSCCVCH
ncbi:hypothetical protein K435DRAFT_973111 [Dendrothele bispora CBS 962.96]|uniref:Uncharacterized protein n=1 Tax=Dendrothele bispora (strain CBS 962.96) TaxID=1314807 RepID=A0A4S8KUJ7_DENBC|nr:hypothetical protein K435DRAFT_973111 [Dendrothele bispora CBS 962.96]